MQSGKKLEQNKYELWDIYKRCGIHIMRKQGEEKEERRNDL